MYLGNHVLKFENVEIDPEDKDKAREELREVPDVVQESLKAFKQLIKGLLYQNLPFVRPPPKLNLRKKIVLSKFIRHFNPWDVLSYIITKVAESH